MKRLKKVSPFVMEALDLPKLPTKSCGPRPTRRSRGSGSRSAGPGLRLRSPRERILPLSFFQVDDYLSCPLKYKFRHLVGCPSSPTIRSYSDASCTTPSIFSCHKKMAGKSVSEEDLIREYERIWVNEGFFQPGA